MGFCSSPHPLPPSYSLTSRGRACKSRARLLYRSALDATCNEVWWLVSPQIKQFLCSQTGPPGTEEHQTDCSKSLPSAPVWKDGLVLLAGYCCCHCLPCSTPWVCSLPFSACSRPQEADLYSTSPGLSAGSQSRLTPERPGERVRSVCIFPVLGFSVAVEVAVLDCSSCQAALNLELQLSLGSRNSVSSPGPYTTELVMASYHSYSLCAPHSVTCP